MSESKIIKNIKQYTITFVGDDLILTKIDSPAPEGDDISQPMTTLDISNNLDISNKNIIALPVDLPQNLQKLYCYNNKITTLLDNLPQSLQQLYCDYNQLTALPGNLPQSLQVLGCSNNQITALPSILPQSLQQLYCSYNKLTALPDNLPQSLQQLYCSNNRLTELPDILPQNLKQLYCGTNQLKILPNLPTSLVYIYLQNNPLEANYPEIFKLTNTKEIVAYVNERNAEMLAEAKKQLADAQALIARFEK